VKFRKHFFVEGGALAILLSGIHGECVKVLKDRAIVSNWHAMNMAFGGRDSRDVEMAFFL